MPPKGSGKKSGAGKAAAKATPANEEIKPEVNRLLCFVHTVLFCAESYKAHKTVLLHFMWVREAHKYRS